MISKHPHNTLFYSIKFIFAELREISTNINYEINHILGLVLQLDPNLVPSLKPELELTEQQIYHLHDIIDRRKSQEPLELILGYTDFLGKKIKVTPEVLIPRVETEQLTTVATNFISRFGKCPTILEIGTGSGCITYHIIDTCHRMYNKSHTLCIEPSLPAYNLTWDNVQNILSDNSTLDIRNISLAELIDSPPLQLDLLISNPPYLTEQEMNELEPSVKDYEPKLALYGGIDGLDYYREIAELISKWDIRPKILLEASPTTTKKVRDLLVPYYQDVEIIPDLFGRERFIVTH